VNAHRQLEEDEMHTERITRIALLTPMAVTALVITGYAQPRNHPSSDKGGPGSWQIEKKRLQDEWLIDCIVDGEAEEIVVPLFEAALRGEPLPR
jgi:hypothetical protein